MRLWAHGGTGPLPHPATQCDYPMGGRVGERAGAASEIALSRFLERTLTHCADTNRNPARGFRRRSEEHTSELQSLMRISYAVFCLKKKKHTQQKDTNNNTTKHKQARNKTQR